MTCADIYHLFQRNLDLGAFPFGTWLMSAANREQHILTNPNVKNV